MIKVGFYEDTALSVWFRFGDYAPITGLDKAVPVTWTWDAVERAWGPMVLKSDVPVAWDGRQLVRLEGF